MIEDLTFLEEGKYTAITSTIRAISEELKRTAGSFRKAISMYVSNLRCNEQAKLDLYRKRTASDILESRYVTGCTDTALAFIVLARALGIPTKYVETLEEKWLNDPEEEDISSHAFVDLFVDGRWRAYEPKMGFTKDNKYLLSGRNYTEIGKGLDFDKVYLKENGIYKPEPISIDSMDKLESLKFKR